MRVLWLPDKLRSYGVTVKEVDGWRTRGTDTLNPKVVIAHHTANPNRSDAPSLNLVVNGRSDLPGPLCQVLLSRSGIAYVVASGKANHAGTGSWKGVSGNTNCLGIEAENDGVGEPWPAQQLEAYRRVCAAMLDGIGQTAEMLCGHKEWAPTRKVDPRGIDLTSFRKSVHALLTTTGGFPMALSDQEQADLAQRVKNIEGVIAGLHPLVDLIDPLRSYLADPSTSNVDAEAIAERIAEQLGDEVAKAVGERLVNG